MAATISMVSISSEQAPLSPCAEALLRCGRIAYRSIVFIAILSLLLSAIFAALTPELMWQRLMTFLALGVVPAAILLFVGWLIFCLCKGASVIYDPLSHFLARQGTATAQLGIQLCCFLVPAITAATNFMRTSGRAIVTSVKLGMKGIIRTLAVISSCYRAIVGIARQISRISIRIIAELWRLAAMATNRVFSLLRAVHRPLVMVVTLPIRAGARMLLQVVPSTA